jgi:hypothetical protein
MKVSKRQLRQIIREERRLLAEEVNTLDRFLTGEYSSYQFGEPEPAARRIKEAIRMLVDATADELPNVGDALEPGFRKSILETIIADMLAKGIKLR